MNTSSGSRPPGKSSVRRGTRTPAGKPRPVARKPRYTRAEIRRNRIVALLIILGIVAVIVVGVRAAWGWVQGMFDAQSQDLAEIREARAIKTYPAPGPCPLTDLEFSAAAGMPAISPGGKLDVTLRVTNKSTEPCTIDGAEAHLGIQIVSGNQIIWNSTTCPATSELNLLLDKSSYWEATRTWQGRLAGVDCAAPAAAAKPGTYRVTAYFDGQAQGGESVFVVH